MKPTCTFGSDRREKRKALVCGRRQILLRLLAALRSFLAICVEQIQRQSHHYVFGGSDDAAGGIFANRERPANTREPRAANTPEVFHRARQDQPILRARSGDVQQSHTLEFFPHLCAFGELCERETRGKPARPVGRLQSQSSMPVERPPCAPIVRLTMKIGNYHYWKLEAFRLVNRHQPNRVR